MQTKIPPRDGHEDACCERIGHFDRFDRWSRHYGKYCGRCWVVLRCVEGDMGGSNRETTEDCCFEIFETGHSSKCSREATRGSILLFVFFWGSIDWWTMDSDYKPRCWPGIVCATEISTNCLGLFSHLMALRWFRNGVIMGQCPAIWRTIQMQIDWYWSVGKSFPYVIYYIHSAITTAYTSRLWNRLSS